MDIFLVVLLVILNGIFAMSEMSLVSAKKVRLQQMADKGNEGEYYNPIGFMNNKTMAHRISYEISCPILTSSRYNTSSLKNGINYTGECANSFPTRWIYEDFENELNDIVQEWKSNNPNKLIGKEQADT